MLPLPMNGNPLYASLFWSAYTVWFLSEITRSFTKRAKGPAEGRDRGSYVVLLVLLYVGIALDFSLCFRLPRAAFVRDRVAIFYAGVALIWIGMIFRWYAVRTLGKFFTFSVAIQSGQTVVQAGPYRYIRHPSYTGALITLLGVGLGLGNWAGLLALMIFTGVAYGYRIYVEELALVGALGQPYEEYRQRTARLIPFVL